MGVLTPQSLFNFREENNEGGHDTDNWDHSDTMEGILSNIVWALMK